MHSISEQFHELYYESRVWRNTFWLGVETLKCPLDLWIYQELLHEVRPRYIIETGTASGGSALFLASVCDLLGTGEIITVDVEEHPARPAHARIEYLTGSSVAEETIRAIKERVAGAGGDPVLAILDSDHSQQHVAQELRIYGAMVTEGSYLIEAVESFLRETPQFMPDREREKFFLTFNPKGYLRKIKG
jgi:cephalosporin hydroxylase